MKKSSPIKGGLTKIQISTTKKMKQRPYELKVMLLKPGNLEIVWCIKPYQQGNDGYTHPAAVAITEDTPMTSAFRAAGYLAKVNRRLDPQTNEKAFNAVDRYPRILYIRCNPDSTHESRIEGLQFFKNVSDCLHPCLSKYYATTMSSHNLFDFNLSIQFMERTENNQFGYQYLVGPDSDLTPPDEALLEPMSSYLLDEQLVELMEQILEGAGPQWYSANQDIANDYFSGPTYPQAAIDSLGYPADNGGNGANHRNFNAPPADEEA
jgi:hypothetical protein